MSRLVTLSKARRKLAQALSVRFLTFGVATPKEETLEVNASSPSGWGSAEGTGHYSVRSQESRAVEVVIGTPAAEAAGQEVKITVTGPETKVAELAVAVTVAKSGLPQ